MTGFVYNWNATFEGQPADTEFRSLGAGRIRDLKKAVSERVMPPGFVNVKEHGAQGDGNGSGGGTNDATAIRDAMDEVEATLAPGVVYFPPGVAYRCDEALGDIDISYISMLGPATIDFTNLAAGTAMNFVGTAGDAFQNILNTIRFMRFIGPGPDTSVNCAILGGGSGKTTRLSFWSCLLNSWQDILTWDNDANQINFMSMIARNCNRPIVYPSGVTGSSESKNLFGCQLGGQDVAFDIDDTGDWYMKGGRIDGIAICDMTKGRLHLDDVHMEELDAQPWADIPYKIIGSNTQLIIGGGSIQSSATNPGATVPVLFQNLAAQTDPARIIVGPDTRIDRFDTLTGFYGQGPGNILIDRRYVLSTSANRRILGPDHSVISDGSFVSSLIKDKWSVKSGTEGASITDRLNTTNLGIAFNTAAERTETFDGTTDVSVADDWIVMPRGDLDYHTGKQLVYQNNANPDIGGLTGGTAYYAIFVTSTVSTVTIQLATSRANADAGTAIPLSATAAGTHNLDSGPGGMRLDVKAGSPMMVLAKPIQPMHAAMIHFWHKLSVADSWDFSLYYANVELVNGLTKIIDQGVDLKSSTLTDTSYTKEEYQRLKSCPAKFTHIVLEFDVSGVTAGRKLDLDDLVLDIQ